MSGVLYAERVDAETKERFEVTTPLIKVIWLYLLAFDDAGLSEAELVKRLKLSERSVREVFKKLGENDLIEEVPRGEADEAWQKDEDALEEENWPSFLRRYPEVALSDLVKRMGVSRAGLYEKRASWAALERALEARRKHKRERSLRSRGRGPEGYKGEKNPLPKTEGEMTNVVKACFLYLRGVEGEKSVDEIVETLGFGSRGVREATEWLWREGLAEQRTSGPKKTRRMFTIGK